MSCTRIRGAIVCHSPSYRLRLADGTCVFMNWHHFCGPALYQDRAECREINDWYDHPLIVQAVDWFIMRGERA